MREPIESTEKITLKEFIVTKFADSDKVIQIALTSLEKRLEGMNEFKQLLKDQAEDFHKRVEEALQELRTAKDIAEGKASMVAVYISYILSIAGIIISIVSLLKMIPK